MSKRWNRMETWLTLVVVGIGAVLAAIAGLHLYVTNTATPLHPDPDRVAMATQSTPSPEWTDAVERGRRIMRAGLIEQNLPGVSVAVGVGDGIVWAEGLGWSDLDKRVPVTPGTRFRIGTASIALTSAAVGLLLEKNRLNLDAEIQTYVPGFPKKQWPVTLRQLMGHTAGVRNDGGDEGPLLSEHCERPVDALPQFSERSLLFEPGTRYRYSSYGWILVSAAMEAAAAESFSAIMRKQVFEPLGMADTRLDAATDTNPSRATPYFPMYAANPRYGLDPMREVDYSCYAGASVFVSTPSDLVRFGLAINGGQLLQPSTVQTLQAPQRVTSGEETGYGLGWDLETVTVAGEQTRVIGHDGDSLGGRVASLWTIPERRLAVAVISNTSYADTAALALGVAQAFAERGTIPARK